MEPWCPEGQPIDLPPSGAQELTSARRDELRLIAAQAGSYKKERLHELFGELKILSPTTGNVLTEPFQFNLMFETK